MACDGLFLHSEAQASEASTRARRRAPQAFPAGQLSNRHPTQLAAKCINTAKCSCAPCEASLGPSLPAHANVIQCAHRIHQGPHPNPHSAFGDAAAVQSAQTGITTSACLILLVSWVCVLTLRSGLQRLTRCFEFGFSRPVTCEFGDSACAAYGAALAHLGLGWKATPKDCVKAILV